MPAELTTLHGLTRVDGWDVDKTLARLYEQTSKIRLTLPLVNFDRLRVVVTGSRDYKRHDVPTAVLMGLSDTYGPLHVTHGAARGLDSLVDILANIMSFTGWTKHVEPCTDAEWKLHGRRAGNLRNERMVMRGQDICLGFPLIGSRGTWNCMDFAFVRKIPTFIVEGHVAEIPGDGPLENWTIRPFGDEDHARLKHR